VINLDYSVDDLVIEMTIACDKSMCIYCHASEYVLHQLYSE